MKLERIPWYLVAGLALGIGLGLLYAWAISPVRYVDTTPAALRAEFKDQYRAVIAAAYAATGDLGRARARLALLGDPDPVQALTAQAQRMLAAGEPFESVRSVAMLAETIQQAGMAETVTSTRQTPAGSTEAAFTTVTSSEQIVVTTLEPTITPLPLISPTTRPTRTPTSTPGAAYIKVSQETVCDPNLPEGLLQVIVTNSAKRQVAGAEIIITWSGGEEHFFTGFKPELGNGYADYQMTTEVSYTLRIGNNGTPVPGVNTPACQTHDGDAYRGGLRLTFQQP